MSYSYIKTVFPQFQNSKAYESMFNSLKSEQSRPANDVEVEGLAPDYASVQKQAPVFEIPSSKLNSFQQQAIAPAQMMSVPAPAVEPIQSLFVPARATPASTPQLSPPGDNLKFYNLPVPPIPHSPSKIDPQPQRLVPPGTKQEAFENTQTALCDTSIGHVLECSRCKDMLVKQFGLDNDRLRQEEIMEMLSYVIFGLFVLLLIDVMGR